MNAELAFNKLISNYEFNTVLDIGSGVGQHSSIFTRKGKNVHTISLKPPAYYIGDYLTFKSPLKYDCIWASHVLEHQPNVNLFLTKCFNDLKDDGIFAVTVPPYKPNIVGGHLTLWNAGLLLYNLIIAGFDCSEAWVRTYGYNVSVILRKKRAVHQPLIMDCGDIEKIKHLFPMPVEQGFNGSVTNVN